MLTGGVFSLAEKYDLIVIGAGNSGLMAACRASRMGLKTLVIERHNMPGGAASSFVRGRFEFEASLHEVPSFGEGNELKRLFDELGIKTDMVQTRDSYRYIVNENGKTTLDVTVPHGREKVLEFIDRECPGDREAMEKFFMAAKDMENGLNYFGNSRGNPDPAVMERDHKNFMKIMAMSSGEFFRSIGMSQKLIDILAAYWPYQGVDIERVDASRYIMMLSGYFLDGAYVPRLRSHQLSLAIAERAAELGCRFLYDTEVTGILTKKGSVSGVKVADGRVFEATAIASSAFPEVVYSKLIDNKDLVPKFELKKANARHYGFRGFSVYLGLDASPEELGIKDYTIFITNSLDTRKLYEDCEYIIDDIPLLDVCCLNMAVPECSPEGTTEIVLTLSYTEDAWADVTEKNYVEMKRKVANDMIDRFEEVLGIRIRDHIEEIEIASPVTFARYMYTPQGTIYGYLSDTWDGMSSRTISNGTEPTVPGLFFVGGHANSLSGYFPTYTSGNRTGFPILGYVMGGGN